MPTEWGMFPGLRQISSLSHMTCIVFVLEKTLILMWVVVNQYLHTPVAFFLGHFSSLQVFYRSATLPQLVVSFAIEDSTVSAHHGARIVSCAFCMDRGFTTDEHILQSVLGCVPPPAPYKAHQLGGLPPGGSYPFARRISFIYSNHFICVPGTLLWPQWSRPLLP